ncbi:MAG: aminotransferase class III-fold pyridoxal phosphate-dependent enzyme, partial [Pseudonocardia sp.]|nr:aminotransferase class III-fold pyridoxal phosphate-dependent enzyme [Pseudonocardia sp.]
VGRGVVRVRCLGLWAGVDIDPALGTGHDVCERMMAHGVLAKDTHGSTLRLAPPLVVEPGELDLAVEALAAALASPR